MSDRGGGEHPVILFDGVCVLCNRTARFVMQRDRRARFRLALLQSPAARRLLGRYESPTPGLDSVVLVAGGRIFRKSRAILEILRRLDAPWPVLYGLVIVPRSLADVVYDFVGARRYKWFGTTTSCAVGDSNRTRVFEE